MKVFSFLYSKLYLIAVLKSPKGLSSKTRWSKQKSVRINIKSYKFSKLIIKSSSSKSINTFKNKKNLVNVNFSKNNLYILYKNFI